MTIFEARRKLDALERKTVLTKEEEFEMIETLEFIIEATGDYHYAQWLGGIYYEKRMFDLALKYYELAESLGSTWAWNGLGYIWYYGRTGKVDYEKAFNYFKKMVDSDSATTNDYARYEARFKIADMYKNGYYVEKSFDEYKRIVEELYDECTNNGYYRYGTEVKLRLADIRAKEGEKDEAVRLYLEAKEELIGRVERNRFFGDLNRINWMVNDLYKLIDFDPEHFDLYDLYYLLKEEHLVSFRYRRKRHEIESKLSEEGDMNIRFDDVWYRDISDFFIKAELGNESIEHEYDFIDDWRIDR